MTQRLSNPLSEAATEAGAIRVERGRGSLLFLAGSLAGGNLIAMVLRLVGGILLGRLVSPSTLGLFTGIGLALGYAPALQLGVLNGLNRELPFFAGVGDRERMKELAAAAQAWAFAVGAVVFVVLSGIGGWYLFRGDGWHAAGWFTNAVMALLLFYSTYYLQMTFRSSHDFARLALANVIESVTGLVMLVLVAFWGFYGLCGRVLLAAASSAVFLHHWRPLRVKPRWNTKHWKHLLVIGAPIFGVGQLYSWWGGVINSTLVLWLAGTKGMGLFSMVLLAIAALEVLPQAVAQVIYPRMAEQYGRGSNVGGLVSTSRRPMLLTVSAMIPIVVVAWILVPTVMRIAVPAYVEAAPAVRWALLLALATCFQPVNSVFNVIRRQDLYATAIVAGIAAYAGSLLILLSGGVTLTAFPQAMLIGRVVYLLVSYWFIVRLKGRERSAETPPSSEGL